MPPKNSSFSSSFFLSTIVGANNGEKTRKIPEMGFKENHPANGIYILVEFESGFSVSIDDH